MLDRLVRRKNATTLPILAVDEAALAAWRKRQSRARQRWLDRSELVGRGNRVLIVPGPEGPDLALLGAQERSPWAWAGAAQRLPPGRYRIDDATALDPAEATDAAVGWALSAYEFGRHKTRATARAPRELVWPKGADRKAVTRRVEATAMVRDWINSPAADLGPAELESDVRALAARHGAKLVVTKGKRLTQRFPLIDAVGRGSDRAPRLLDLRWGKRSAPRVTLVGKGVCFDSGGLDLKSASGMLTMKKDMGGAAIVLGLAHRIMDAGLPVQLRVLVPSVENLPGPGAYRPMDVLRSRSGLTVEVSNTDAEGRLILADALSLADEEEPDLLIDVATLTGSARLALGTEISALFCDDRELADALLTAGREQRDLLWRLPLHRGYRRLLDSRTADLKNAASTSRGGAISAALFLREFVQRTKAWIHLDVFGWNDTARPGRPVGGEATSMNALFGLLEKRYAAS